MTPEGHPGAGPSRPAALEMRAVARHRGARRVLGPLDLTVAGGETVAVLGPNGAGKSTLLGLAAGILQASAGAVRIAGADPGPEGERTRKSVSVLTQEAPLYDELTPHEHLTWWARLRGVAVDADGLLAQAGLARLAHRPCGQLSRGERQKAAIAMALVGDPPLLLLDEPFTALDEAGRAWLEGVLATRRGRDSTIVALHDPAQAERLADRVLRLQDGRWSA